MQIDFEAINSKLVIKVNGDIDHHTCEEIRNKVDQEIMKRNPKHIIFDMEKVGFMDSSGIGVIIGRYKIIAGNSGKTIIANVKPQIKRVYDICGLNKIIPIYASINQALEAL